MSCCGVSRYQQMAWLEGCCVRQRDLRRGACWVCDLERVVYLQMCRLRWRVSVGVVWQRGGHVYRDRDVVLMFLFAWSVPKPRAWQPRVVWRDEWRHARACSHSHIHGAYVTVKDRLFGPSSWGFHETKTVPDTDVEHHFYHVDLQIASDDHPLGLRIFPGFLSQSKLPPWRLHYHVSGRTTSGPTNTHSP